jgi:hypothetical protein
MLAAIDCLWGARTFFTAALGVSGDHPNIISC